MNDLDASQLLLLTREMSKHLDADVHNILCKCLFVNNFYPYNHTAILAHQEIAKNEAAKERVNAFVEKHIFPIVVAADQEFFSAQDQFSIAFIEPTVARNKYGDHNLIRAKDQHLPDLYSGELVFISHSSEDKVLAATLGTYLRVLEYPCFVAHDSISGGKAWPKVINDKLDNMQIFIACMTDNFQGSAYCHQECGYAVARAGENHVKIIPLLFGKNHPEAMLRDTQGIKIGSPQIKGEDLAKIVQAMQPDYS